MSFVHLHNHSYYSLLDGLSRPQELAKAAKKQGSPAVALTDHGVMYGALEFYKACKKEEIKPILGCEVYVAKKSRLDKTNEDRKSYHLILLAENNIGYENILSLVTKAHMEGMYYKPRVDLELLKKHSEGVIALSACIKGVLSDAILNNNESLLTELIDTYQDIFGMKNFFLEIQHHPEVPGQIELTQQLIRISKEKNIPLIASQDSHYVQKEDAEAQDTLLAIQMNRDINDPTRMTMMNENYSLRSPEEMKELFSEVPEAIENTLRIAERCDVHFELGNYEIPEFVRPEGWEQKSAADYFRHLCIEGLQKRYPAYKEYISGKETWEEDLPENKNGATISKRFEYEFSIIEKMGFENYFLIVWDYVRWAKEHGVMVGPGRGSGAGSIIAYALNITDLDPLQFGLLFERFLNPERISMPDFDIDFADDRRDEVIAYVFEKYGKDHVAQISTFGTMAARAAVKDVGRAHGIPFGEMNSFAKLIPDRPGTTLDEGYEQNPEIKKTLAKDERLQKVWNVAKKLEGCIRHISVHACAVVISAKPLEKYTAVQYPPKDTTTIISQFSAKPLEELGLLKMDFLGLKNLTILQKALAIIKRISGRRIDLETISLDDKKTYELFQKGETTGIFQFESAGMKRYLKELQPTEFEDLIVMNSLYRPGPMEWIPDYIKGKHKKRKVKYADDCLKPILAKTYGIGVYQEQILQIAQAFAGYSLGEADILRRAIGKKIASEMEAQRSNFIQKAADLNRDKKLAETIFDTVIEPFAGYGFNKSHSASYAMIAYQTAYLKAHHPTEFMAAIMSSDAGNTDRLAIEIAEASEMNIEILPPSVNESLKNFTVVSNRKIRFGLSAIKGVGDSIIEAIKTARGEDNVPFRDLEDFLKRVHIKDLNKKSLEALIKSGALDDFGERKQLFYSIESMIEHARDVQKNEASGQMGLFGDGTDSLALPGFALAKIETPATIMESLNWEKDLLGLFVSAHPLAGLEIYWKKKMKTIKSLDEKMKGKIQKVGGIINSLRTIFTKKKETMAVLQIEDTTGKIEVTLFPSTWKHYSKKCQEGGIICCTGKVVMRTGNIQINAESVVRMNFDSLREEAKQQGILGTNKYLIKEIPPEETKETEAKEEKKEETAVTTEKTASSELLEETASPKEENHTKEPPLFSHEISTLTLNIPAAATKHHFYELKSLCESQSGKREIELHFPDGSVQPLPYTVQENEEFEVQAKKIFNVS